MKKTKLKEIFFIIWNVIAVVFMLFFFMHSFVLVKDANDVFNKNIESVVELKASTEEIGESFGTAIIIDNNGLIITNAHVVTYESLGELKLFDKIQIRFASQEEYLDVTFQKYDLNYDLALLKINGDKYYNSICISDKKYSSGDKVYAMGNSSNYGIGITEGIISVPELNIIYQENQRLVIQADVVITTGNSGGALLDKKGNLIGITTFRTKNSSGNIVYGLAYSIPQKIIREFIREE